MIRTRIAPLHESSHATVRVGAVSGAIAGATSAASFVAAASDTDAQYVSVLFGNVIGVLALLVFALIFGTLAGAAIGSIEASASFAIALIAADKGISARNLYTTLGLACIAINVTFASLAAVIFLGVDGSGGGDFVGALIVIFTTAVVTFIFGWAQSLDWPEPIKRIDLRRPTRAEETRTDLTVEHTALTDTVQSHLHR